jgi:hypothetical protein
VPKCAKTLSAQRRQGFFFADMMFEISDLGLIADITRIIKLAEVFQNKAIRFIHLKHYF